MFLDFGLFLDAVLFVVGAYWCYEMFGRWSTDGDQVLRMQRATRALKRSRQDAGGAELVDPALNALGDDRVGAIVEGDIEPGHRLFGDLGLFALLVGDELLDPLVQERLEGLHKRRGLGVSEGDDLDGVRQETNLSPFTTRVSKASFDPRVAGYSLRNVAVVRPAQLFLDTPQFAPLSRVPLRRHPEATCGNDIYPERLARAPASAPTS